MGNPVLILYLEDNSRDAELVRDRLLQSGLALELRIASDRAEYEAELAGSRFDLILSDYKLPSYDGMTALRAARSKQPDVPFILISGTLGEEQAVDCVLLGATDYVLKQNLGRLVPAVMRALTEGEEHRKRRKAEEALRESEERFRILFEQAADSILLLEITPEGIPMIRDVNSAALRRLGYERDELIGQPVSAIDVAPDASKVNEKRRQDILAETGAVFEARHRCKDGMIRDFECSVSEIQMGSRTYAISVERDITERKRAEEERARLAAAVEQAAETIMITDVAGKILYANPAFEKIAGYTRAEALGQNPRLLKSGKQDAEFYREMWALLAAGQVWSGHLINKRKDGTLYEEEATISPVRDVAGTIVNYVAVKRDVTHEVQLETQFHQAQKMEAVGRLAGGIAHDFNNLLMVINGYSDLVADGLAGNPRLQNYAREIRHAGERATALTCQLLAFSRKQVLQPVVLDLNAVIADLQKMLNRLIGEDIRIVINPDRALVSVKADPGQIEQVLINLAVNARDAMPAGGRLLFETANAEFDELSCREHVDCQPGRYVMVAVSDTGCGMTEEVKSRMFEPFFTTKAEGKGTGLGLATVFGIVRQSGGFIDVQSELGAGTTFRVYLPQVTEQLPPGRPDDRGGNPSHGTETILLVEDDEALRSMVRVILNNLGYTVLEAANGVAALRVADKGARHLDLVLTDVVMPEMSGPILVQSLLRSRPDLKVIYMSGYSETSGNFVGVSKEAAIILKKPFSTNDLTLKVRQVLDAKAGAETVGS